jgi:hypothetical protein
VDEAFSVTAAVRRIETIYLEELSRSMPRLGVPAVS